MRAIIALVALSGTLAAQAPPDQPLDSEGQRIEDRIRALQREAERLATDSRTLLGEIRRLEIERDLRAGEARAAEAAAAAAQQALQQTDEHIAQLAQQRLDALPDVKSQLVDLYKRGRGGNTRLLLGATSIREFARARRSVAALATINDRRIAEHRATLEGLRQQHAAAEQTARELKEREAEARLARTAAERAVAARAALLARIDSQRDLNAQYVGELRAVAQRLQQQVDALAAEPGGATVSIPLTPFRGALAWPAAGIVTANYGQSAGRLGGTAGRNGIELAAPEGAAVEAIHGGTVGYAGAFTGFGTLVILDHGGNNYSLYGYLGSISVERGQAIDGGAELGRVGFAPAGPPALYFELRIDGQSVDPLQWLKPR